MSNYIILILIHALSDLVFLGNTFSGLKEKKFLYLLVHVVIYMILLLLASLFLLFMPISLALLFVAINAGAHFIIDLVTSTLKTKFWQEEKENAYFITSALDQLLHVSLLLGTFHYFAPMYIG
ncbi:MAG: DUF3307 domain-containing protein [Bacteroidota bacterium]